MVEIGEILIKSHYVFLNEPFILPRKSMMRNLTRRQNKYSKRSLSFCSGLVEWPNTSALAKITSSSREDAHTAANFFFLFWRRVLPVHRNKFYISLNGVISTIIESHFISSFSFAVSNITSLLLALFKLF